MAVVSKTTAKAIGKEKHEQKFGLSRNNQFRVIDGENHVFKAETVESVIVQTETIPFIFTGIDIDY